MHKNFIALQHWLIHRRSDKANVRYATGTEENRSVEYLTIIEETPADKAY